MFFLLLLTIVSALLSVVCAAPVKRDVWVPPITYPTSGTVWVAGGTYTVTWNTTNEPSQVTNPMGQVYLRHGDATQESPIATDFALAAGAVSVTIPTDTQPDTNWMVVLFGDSGNWSPPITINAPSSS